jgi:hypothetical protein
MRKVSARMKTLAAIVAAGSLFAASGVIAAELRGPEAFSGIKAGKERAVALFNEAGKVLQHPRCVNCHPASQRPLQGDDQRPHEPLVVRGDGGLGAPGMRCVACHGPANFEPARVPGNPKWQLAPAEMAWEKKSLKQICEQIKDPERNGGKDMAALIHHMAEDELVGWGWHPGPGRQAAPGSQKQFGALIQAWADAGASCPE